MGLDNIPHEYPCRKQRTAIVRLPVEAERDAGVPSDCSHEGQIDCDATIKAGGCPWQTDPSKPNDGGVLGMFGTHCWYRGKYGNFLLDALRGAEEPSCWHAEDGLSFYGTNEDATFLPPADCQALAYEMEQALQERGGTLMLTQPDEDRTSDAKYAIWWLRWVAENAGGSDAWY